MLKKNLNNNMSKEKILEEFDKKFKQPIKWINLNCKDEIICGIDINNLGNELKQFLSQAINQTREETIRECEGVLPEENYGHEDNCSTEYKNGWNDCREEIKQSLINLRK